MPNGTGPSLLPVVRIYYRPPPPPRRTGGRALEPLLPPERGRTAGRVWVQGWEGARTVGRDPDEGLERTVGALLVLGRLIGGPAPRGGR